MGTTGPSFPSQPCRPAHSSTSTSSAGAIGGSGVSVASAVGFSSGDTVLLGNASNQETVTVVAVSGTSLSFAAPFKFAHGVGEPIVRTGGNLQYQDLELPQDVCAAPYNRVSRFGKNSEPTLTAAGELFASGLSTKGRLTAGANGQAFYGAPLVAWTPALGATVYEVQWSKKAYPFKPLPNPSNSGALGTLVLGTSDDPAAQARHLVLPRARLQLRPSHRRTADVLVRPGQDRRRQAQVPRHFSRVSNGLLNRAQQPPPKSLHGLRQQFSLLLHD